METVVQLRKSRRSRTWSSGGPDVDSSPSWTDKQFHEGNVDFLSQLPSSASQPTWCCQNLPQLGANLHHLPPNSEDFSPGVVVGPNSLADGLFL